MKHIVSAPFPSPRSPIPDPFLHALTLAQSGMGRCWPNPSVGCVIVKGDRVVGAARTADGGRPHAETQALAQAGETARGATAYVTLEPCAHYGQTPPCAQALIDAGIARVVVGCTDPDPRVAGKGIAMLEAAGIEVVLSRKSSVVRGSIPTTHDLELTTLYKGFFRRVTHGLPEVWLKLATSMDGRITDAKGASQWITGEAARAHGHGLRSQVDAIVTGIGTVLKDDPSLTVRMGAPAHPNLVRVVLDRTLRLPLNSQLVRTATMQPTWVVTTPEAIEAQASHAVELREAGVVFVVSGESSVVRKDRGGSTCTTDDSRLTTLDSLRALAAAGLNRILIEAGTGLATAFLGAGAVDRLHWYRAPILLGNAGQPAIDALESDLSTAPRWRMVAQEQLGEDSLTLMEGGCLPD